MRSRIRRQSFAAIALVFSMASEAETLNVAVASNFATTLEAIAAAFEAASAHEVRVIRGSSGKHYAQIVSGAPFDVFLSADRARPARLQEEGHAIPGSLRTYALGQLALWGREEGVPLSREYLENTDNYETIAIANPRLAPYGEAARQVLDRLGLAGDAGSRVVLGENIAQTFQFAYSGSADIALIAYSQTLAPNLQGRGSTWPVPITLHAPIQQDMVLLRQSEATAEFAAFMGGPVVEDILIKNGYLLPESEP